MLLLLSWWWRCWSGYVSARLYKTFKGTQWQRCTVFTATWYPGICFIIFLALDLVDVSYGSSGAVPFLEMLKLLTLWSVTHHK